MINKTLYKKPRVLVTGPGGFIGRSLLPVLQQSDYEIHIVGQHYGDLNVSQFTWHQIDLLDSGNWENLIEKIGATYLIHLAWCRDQSKNLMSECNNKWVLSSMRLIDSFLAGGGKRVVVAGSCAEYSQEYIQDCLNEISSPLASNTIYGRSKITLHDTIVSKYPKLSIGWARIFVPYGPFDYPRRLVTYVAMQLLKNEEALCSAGTQILDFIYVRDVANAIVHLMKSSFSGAVNIGSGKGYSVRETVEMIGISIGKINLVKWGAIPAGKIEGARVVACIDRLKNEVGYEPQYSLEQGICEIILKLKQEIRINQ